VPIRNHEGHTVGVVLVFSDVTERYRVEQVMRASADVLRLRDRALAENLQGATMADVQGCIARVNPSSERFTGYAETEALDISPLQVAHGTLTGFVGAQRAVDERKQGEVASATSDCSCASRRRWNPLARPPAASHTTSTTS
jgi:hypothetical protein